MCPRCADETGVYPRHGPFASLGGWVGLERYTCTRCRHGFWHRPEERHRVAPLVPDGAAPLERHDRDVAEAPAPDAALTALDVGPGASASGPPDLAALDDELARLRGTRRRR